MPISDEEKDTLARIAARLCIGCIRRHIFLCAGQTEVNPLVS